MMANVAEGPKPERATMFVGRAVVLCLFLSTVSTCATPASDPGRRKYEDILIEQLSRGPIPFADFRRAVLSEMSYRSVLYNLNNADAAGPDRCRDWITARAANASFPVVWAPGHAIGDVNEVYSIGIHGAGWGGGDLKGSFEVYVSSDGKVVGWHTNIAEWRTRIEPHWK